MAAPNHLPDFESKDTSAAWASSLLEQLDGINGDVQKNEAYDEAAGSPTSEISSYSESQPAPSLTRCDSAIGNSTHQDAIGEQEHATGKKFAQPTSPQPNTTVKPHLSRSRRPSSVIPRPSDHDTRSPQADYDRDWPSIQSNTKTTFQPTHAHRFPRTSLASENRDRRGAQPTFPLHIRRSSMSLAKPEPLLLILRTSLPWNKESLHLVSAEDFDDEKEEEDEDEEEEEDHKKENSKQRE